MIILGSLLLLTLVSKLTKVYGISRSLRPLSHQSPSSIAADFIALDHLTGLIEFGTASRFHSRTRIDNGTDVDSNHVSSATLLTRLSEKTCAIRSQVYLSRYPQRVTAKYELRLRSGE
jgi:hypothetical protein